MIRACVLGYGYWGPNIARNLAETPGATVAGVCDPRTERLELARRRYPAAKITSDWRELIADPAMDAVLIATPISTHFPLALEALRAGKHVFVEKPLAARSDHAACLIDEAAARRLVLMTGHVFVYTEAVRKMREILRMEAFGSVYYYDSVRVNLGIFQQDFNVLWDLATHDLSILDYLVGERPCAVSATGASHLPDGLDNTAYLTAFFNSPLIAHVGVNWLAPVKVRQTLIGGSQQMIVYDDLEPSEKVKVYDKGVSVNPDHNGESVYRTRVSYRTGDMWAPNLDTTEPLRSEMADFANSILSGQPPVADGAAGLRVVEVLEAAAMSMGERGRPVELPAGRISQ